MISQSNLNEDSSEDTDSDFTEDSELKRIEQGIEAKIRLEDRTIRERVAIMKKRKFCVF
jgi:hypothetical protein